MRWEIITVVLFWLIYGPFSFIIWENFSRSGIEFIAILGAGIGFTFTFFSMSLVLQYIGKKVRKRKYQTLIQSKMEILQELRKEPEIPAHLLTNVFTENFGRIEYDLD